MNPTTGTFISMDTYQGSIFEPVSLHKYLYANANPVMYNDPSGYMAQAVVLKMEASHDAWCMAVYAALMSKLVYDVSIYVYKNVINDFILDILECTSFVANFNIASLVSKRFIDDALKQV